MKVDLLNVRITIEKNSVVTDAIGNHKNGWTDFYSCFATASGGNVSEKTEDTEAGVTVSNEKLDFTIRWCKKTSEIDSMHFRVRLGADLYDIKAVDPMNFKKKCIKLRCQRVRR